MVDKSANDFFQSVEALLKTVEDDEPGLDIDWDELESDDHAWVRCPYCGSDNVTMFLSFPDDDLDFGCDDPDCMAHSSVVADADPDDLLSETHSLS